MNIREWKFGKTIGEKIVVAFSLFVFIFLPFVSTEASLDPEIALRILFSSLFVVIITVLHAFPGERKMHIERGVFRVFVIAIMLLLWAAIRLIPSVNPGDAISEWLRMAVCFGLLFVLYISLNDSGSGSVRWLCRSALFAVLIFSAFAFLQMIDGIDNTDPNYRMTNAVWSTLSNKNFFAETLVMLLPFIIHGFRYDKRGWKILFSLALFLDLGFVIFVQSVSAWLGLGVGVMFYLFFALRANTSAGGKRIARVYKLVLIIITGVVLSSVLLPHDNFIYRGVSGKLKNTIDYIRDPELINTTRKENNNSVFERLLLWRNSIRMIGDHPVTGAGLNNWKIYNASYGIGGTQYTNSGMMGYEHPHNEYLLILAEQGPPGIILYLLFIVFVIRLGLKASKTEDEPMKNFLLLLVSSIIAFSIMSLFSYPRSRMYSMILLIITSAFILSRFKAGKGLLIQVIPVYIIIIVISLFAAFVYTTRFISETHIKKTILAQIKGNFPRMAREADMAASFYYPLDIYSTPVYWYSGMAQFYQNNLPGAITEYEKAILIHPNHLRVLNDLATCYEHSGQPKQAIYYYRKALSISPLFIEGNLNLSAAYFNSGNADSAYYFIDRIYGLQLSMGENSTYQKFLPPILTARLVRELGLTNDSAETVRLSALPLVKIYNESKETGEPLIQRVRQAGKF